MSQNPKLDNLSNLSTPLFIIGAAHTGKSELVLQLVEPDHLVVVLGTASTKEPEFTDRLSLLKSLRPNHWHCIEDISSISQIYEQATQQYDSVIIDSINQWVASFIVENIKSYSTTQLQDLIDHELSSLLTLIETSKTPTYIVSTEVGGGLSPKGQVPRLFRQMVSRYNCLLANISQSVLLVSAGIPLVLKSSTLSETLTDAEA